MPGESGPAVAEINKLAERAQNLQLVKSRGYLIGECLFSKMTTYSYC